jgi:two-component system, LytTR family, response regulator
MNKPLITAILIDDEERNNQNLSDLLNKHCPTIQLVGIATSIHYALDLIANQNPSVVFLDIQLKNETGFDLLKQYEKIPFEIIFVTAFDEYGVPAIKFSAIDYLLKPIDTKELINAVEKVSIKLQQKTSNELLENLKQNIFQLQDKSKHKIALPTLHETHLVRTSEIIHCESDNSYTTFYLQQNKTLVVCKSIKEFEQLLTPYGFIRVHQSHLVNKEYISSFSKKEGFNLLLENGEVIPVSKNKKDEVVKELGF